MRKVGIIIIALVLVLGALGVGYAQWSHTITVNATVNTGTASAIFSNSLMTTNADNFGDNITYATAEPYGDGTILAVTVYHAYPGVKITDLPYYVKNVGDVPIKVDSLTLRPEYATQVAFDGGKIPGDALIAPGDAGDGSETTGSMTFQLSTDTEVIPEGSSFVFYADLAFSVVVGP